MKKESGQRGPALGASLFRESGSADVFPLDDIARDVKINDAKPIVCAKWLGDAKLLEVVMQKRHENALYDLLERVAFEGFAAVEKWQLTRWYGQERFSVGIRRDVVARWDDLRSEVSSIGKKELKFAEAEGQILLMHDQIFFEDE